MAAHTSVCLPFEFLRARAIFIVALVLLLVSSVSLATPAGNLGAPASRSSDSHSDLATQQQQQRSDQQQASQQPAAIIDDIRFVGNRRIRNQNLNARIFSRVGDVYNDETLKRDFQALWNTQFFEDIKLRVEDPEPGHKVIIFEVKERPIIRRIRYEGEHSISESDILDRFKDRKVGLTVESQFDPTRIKKAEVVIKELLAEHGHQYAKVTPQYERIAASNAVILIFKIEEGPKVKVGRIIFKGNHAFSARKIIRAMHNDRPYAIPMYLFNIDVMHKTYDRDKLSEDIAVGITGLYQDNGYFEVRVDDPVLQNVDTRDRRLGMPLMGHTKGKAVNITITIHENARYKMGTLKIVSADPDKALSLKAEALKTLFPMHEGDIFSSGKVRKALQDYTKAYGQYGFIDMTAQPETIIDEAAKRIDITLRISEDKQFFVRRIDFVGNTTTRDKVIRRELLLDEGMLFNKRLWEISILRLNQLDYFDRIEEDKAVEIKRNTKEGTVDITLKLKEKGKQSIGLTGGVSGLAGTFIGLTYQTNNFLGLGENLKFSAQFGDLQRSFQFGFTEPYLFDRPIATGFNLFDTRINFNQAKQEALLLGQSVSLNPQYIQNYSQNSKGFTIFASYPVKKLSFTRLALEYGLTRTDIESFNTASTLLFEELEYRSIAGPSALSGIVASTISPSITYNTIDNPLNSHKGKSYQYRLDFTGGPLGGNVNTVRNVGDFKYFHPVHKNRNVVGFHLTSAYITGFDGKEIPPFSRFYMGGEQDIRGFDIRSISPVTFIPSAVNQQFFYTDNTKLGPSGAPTQTAITIPVLTYVATLPGGDLQSSGNFEYRIPIAGPVTLSLFLDGGTDGILNKNALRLNPAGVTSIEQQFPGATLNTGNLPIASGTNFRLRGSTGVEFSVILPIVQAPFRIYYAYNIDRLHSQIIAPAPFVDPSELKYLKDVLPPDVFNNQIFPTLQQDLVNPGRLLYFEPRTTFRFTVGKTF